MEPFTPEFSAELLKTAITLNGNALKHVQEDFITDELCLLAVQQDYRAVKYVPVNRYNSAIALAVVKQTPSYISNFPEAVITPEIVLAAAREELTLFKYAKYLTKPTD